MDKYGDKTIYVLQDVRVDQLRERCDHQNTDTVQQYFATFDGSDEYCYTTDQETDDLNYQDTCISRTPAPVVDECDVNELIIDAVRARPPLWNIRDMRHKNRLLRNRMWEEVAIESNFAEDGENGPKAHKMWDCLKANYLRWKKKDPSGSAGGKKKEYKYARQMSFLDDTAEPRRSTELCVSISEEAGDSSNYQEDRDIETPRASSRKRNYQQQALDLKREYVDIQNKKLKLKGITCSCPTAPAPDLVDVEIDGFCTTIKCHLKRLNLKARLDVQAQFLKILGLALDNEENH